MNEYGQDSRLAAGPLRLVFYIGGWVCLGFGALGVLLPVLPTTPLVILAAFCFARSSRRFYEWLVKSRMFGSLIRNWEDTRSIPRRTKTVAILLILFVGGSSVVFFLPVAWVKILIAVILLSMILWIARVPATESIEDGSVGGRTVEPTCR